MKVCFYKRDKTSLFYFLWLQRPICTHPPIWALYNFYKRNKKIVIIWRLRGFCTKVVVLTPAFSFSLTTTTTSKREKVELLQPDNLVSALIPAQTGKFLVKCPIIVVTKFSIWEQRSNILCRCGAYYVQYSAQTNLHSTFHSTLCVDQRHPY